MSESAHNIEVVAVNPHANGQSVAPLPPKFAAYRRRSPAVEAFRWDGLPVEGYATRTDPRDHVTRLVVPCIGRDIEAESGDWIVAEKVGAATDRRVYGDRTFHEHYEEAR